MPPTAKVVALALLKAHSMHFLLRFSQSHESFRVPEIEALAQLEGIEMRVVDYNPDSPFCIIHLEDPSAAPRLIRRSLLTQSISELWARTPSIPELHDALKADTAHPWEIYKEASWKFRIDSYRATRPRDAVVSLINSFSFLGFTGPVALRNPEQTFSLFEEWPDNSPRSGDRRGAAGSEGWKLEGEPTRVFFGRMVGIGGRALADKYDLKKRRYIATTSMDTELALVTANMALAAPGKLFYDPFVGTGSFPIACAHFGALAWGSDIDGRTIRGKEGEATPKTKKGTEGPGSGTCIRHNFEQYNLMDRFGPMFAADLTNTPIRVAQPGVRLFDGIICDPPYGVREGLRVLGHRDPENSPWVLEAAMRLHKDATYIPSRKPYSFHAMLDDILVFASQTLVDDGRLSFWMPTSNDEGNAVPVPEHPCLEIVSVCTQALNKYTNVDQDKLKAYVPRKSESGTANALNPFRKEYFDKLGT